MGPLSRYLPSRDNFKLLPECWQRICGNELSCYKLSSFLILDKAHFDKCARLNCVRTKTKRIRRKSNHIKTSHFERQNSNIVWAAC